MNDRERVVAVMTALTEEVVGPHGLSIAVHYFGGTASLSELATIYEMSASTLHRRLNRLWSRLEAQNAVPAGWNRRAPGRPPGPLIVSTGKELHAPISDKSQ